jgi:hypothetical protein
MGIDGTTYTAYSFRFESLFQLERGKANTIELRAYLDGAEVTITSGTISVYSEDNTAIVDAQAVSISGTGSAQYTVAAVTLPSTLDFAAGWRIEWSLVMPDTLTHNVRTDAVLCRNRLYAPIAAADLYRIQPSLNPSATGSMVASTENWQDQIDEVWVRILNDLVRTGTWPGRIISPSAFRQVAIYRVLEIVFEHMETVNSDPRWNTLAQKYGTKAEAAWGRLNYIYDNNDDGQADSEDRVSAFKSVWLGSGRR